MPRTRSLAWSELKVGVLTIAALVITAITIFSLTGGKGFPWQRYALRTRFDNVAGLKPGSPVRVAGMEVGSVTDVTLAGGQVDVTFEVNQDKMPWITARSVASLGSVSLLGESAVDITAAPEGEPIEPGGYVPSGPAVGQLSDVAASASVGLDELTQLLQGVRRGEGTMGRLMTDAALYEELRAFAGAASGLTQSLRDGKGSIGQLLNDPTMTEALEASVQNVEALTRRIREGDGSLGRLVNDPAFASNLTDATGNLRTLTTKLNEGDGTVGKLVNDPSLYNQLDSVAGRLDRLIDDLNQGNGTAGQMLKDQRLYENMNAAIDDVRGLVADIRKDPRRYLNVRVSIF